MTRDEIISMAREAGFLTAGRDRYLCCSDDILRFAALVAARKREACAEAVKAEREACADAARQWEDDYVIEDSAPRHVDAAIRSRADHEVTK